MSVWRVGTKVPINVYKDDQPVCQCQTPELAAEIVDGMNRYRTARMEAATLCAEIARKQGGSGTGWDVEGIILREFGVK